MTAELLSSVAGVVLSLLFSYVPTLNTWYAALTEQGKKLLMLVLLALVAGGSYGLSCLGWAVALGLTVTCDQAGAQQLVTAFILALVANQATHRILPETQAVKAAKSA